VNFKFAQNEILVGQIAKRLLQEYQQKSTLNSQFSLKPNRIEKVAKLIHLDSCTSLELNPKLSVIHIGKPNGLLTPDVNVAQFPNSNFVSRIHANIYKEGDDYFIKDMGSKNGTYLNRQLLLARTRYILKPGDQISLSQKDFLTFIFFPF
jgi:hypothetical protein